VESTNIQSFKALEEGCGCVAMVSSIPHTPSPLSHVDTRINPKAADTSSYLTTQF